MCSQERKFTVLSEARSDLKRELEVAHADLHRLREETTHRCEVLKTAHADALREAQNVEERYLYNHHLLETSDLDTIINTVFYVNKILIINCLFQLACKYHVVLRVFPRISTYFRSMIREGWSLPAALPFPNS